MLEPILDILPKAQRELWPDLAKIPDRYVLYGGTALALRLGHRSSVPPIDAVKALAYHEEDTAEQVDAATRHYLTRQASRWDLTVSAVRKAATSLSGP